MQPVSVKMKVILIRDIRTKKVIDTLALDKYMVLGSDFSTELRSKGLEYTVAFPHHISDIDECLDFVKKYTARSEGSD